jgi:transcriptional regulator with XRE-family HTH domain
LSQDSSAGRATPTQFPELLRWYRQRAGLSQNRLARLAGIDPAYVNRIEAAAPDDAVVPRLPILAALGAALELTPAERDRLYFAAGRLPPALSRLGQWDSALAVVADLLTAPGLSPDDLAEFRAVLGVLADRWRRSVGG